MIRGTVQGARYQTSATPTLKMQQGLGVPPQLTLSQSMGR